jgi:hypothetical protein
MAVYGLDLIAALPAMSWRRFKTLLYGLPPSCALLQYLVALNPEPSVTSGEEVLAYLTRVGW